MIRVYFVIAATVFIVHGAPIDTSETTNSSLCEWRGTAPLCPRVQFCGRNQNQIGKSTYAPVGEENQFRASCLMGSKIKCCLVNTFEGKWLTHTPWPQGSTVHCKLHFKPSLRSKTSDHYCGHIKCVKQENIVMYMGRKPEFEKFTEEAVVTGQFCDKVNLYGQNGSASLGSAIYWSLDGESAKDYLWTKQK